MKTVYIKTNISESTIFIGEKLINLTKYLPADRKIIIITDSNIKKYYGSLFPPCDLIEIGLGEGNKTIQTLEYIFSKFVEFEADRSSFVVAIGGGIVCDIAGFAASVFMRGLKFGFVSTSLLSQVDASVGGKNGVNFQGFKNMIGVFNQPEFVICDIEMLKTLPEKEFISGFAEIVKVAAIKDEVLFSYIESNYKKAVNFDLEVLEHIIYESVTIKAKVVEADEREKGERRKLNFGHTFAHSFEKLTGMLHGEAVSIGMVLASNLSGRMGYIDFDEAQRLKILLENIGLPVVLAADAKDVFGAMKKDKKREGNTMHMVLLERIGEAMVKPVTLDELELLINDLYSNIN